MKRVVLNSLVVLLLASTLMAGCNVYEGLYEEGQSDDPEALLEDARLAIQRDEPEQAVTHLRKALDKTQPGTVLQKRVQIKLASAVLEANDIDVMSFSRLARNFNAELGAEKVVAGKTSAETCNFPASHSRVAFDPRDGVDFSQLGSTASEAALAEAELLIERVLTGTETSANPTFPCDDAAMDQAIADLLNQGMTQEEVAEALIDYAVSVTTLTYLDIVDLDASQFYYVTPPSGGPYVGVCFMDSASCQDSITRTLNHMPGLDCTTRLLQKRAELLGSTSAIELADIAREGFEDLDAGIQDASCIEY